MERYSIQQRVEIVKIYYQNGSSVRQTFRVLREVYGVRPCDFHILFSAKSRRSLN